MVKKFLAVCFSFAYLFASADDTLSVVSPNHTMRVEVYHQSDGGLKYSLMYKGKIAIKPSMLGLNLKNPDPVTLDKFDVVNVSTREMDETWKPVWGEVSSIRNHFDELVIHLKDKAGSGILIDIVFRAFDDGVGFRYEFPQQEKMNYFIVTDELTQFALGADHMAFWIPGDYDSNEYSYFHTRLSEVNIDPSIGTEIAVRTTFDNAGVQTPLMMKSDDGLYINIHEAALVNYPAMDILIDKSNFTLKAQLVPDAVGNKAYLHTPSKTPWRTILVTDKAKELLVSRMILNLNEPSRIADPSWIKPQKFVGVWWEMHIGKASWDYGTLQPDGSIKPHGHHGANTANVKKYIDFASKNGFDGVLVEGWNTGWEDWFGHWKENVFDFVTPYPDYDVNGLEAYAKQKGVKIIMHNETSGSATNYERQMDTAYRFMINHNMNSVKTGYVGKIIPRGEHHDGQWMVDHYIRVAQKTASYKIMVDMHEPVRPTGLQRTYPNWLACEAARGNEFNAWSAGNPPTHETILPFTRLMGGPMDYTPGLFRIKLNQFDTARKNQIHTTLAKQLALYVTMYSPLQMAADLPENYEAHPDALQFIKDVAVDWDDTKIIDAEPGDYIIEARKAKGKPNWFMGAITDENARNFSFVLDFLDDATKYTATIYHDADNADWKNNPEAYVIEKFVVDNKTKLKLKLAPGGGTAISFIPATADESKRVKKYR